MLLVLRLLPLRIRRAWRKVPDEVRLTHVPLREKSGSDYFEETATTLYMPTSALAELIPPFLLGPCFLTPVKRAPAHLRSSQAIPQPQRNLVVHYLARLALPHPHNQACSLT